MKKKILAVILALVLALSASVPVFAASTVPDVNEFVSAVKGDVSAFISSVEKLKKLSGQLKDEMGPYLTDVVLTSDNLDTAVEIGSKVMIKLIDKIGESMKPQPTDPTKPTDPTDPTKPTDPTDPTDPTKPTEPQPSKIDLTVAELKKIISKYIFVKVDDIDDATKAVLEGNGILDEDGNSNEVKYYTVTLEDGSTTVYVAVDIEAHPEVFNYQVFKNTVEAIYAQQGKELIKDSDNSVDYLMSYEHIAGELALHAILYAATNELIDVTGTQNSLILKLYKSAAQADLNIDEARLPSALISILGVLLVDMFAFNVFKLFKGIK